MEQLKGDEIVISGISGLFPDAENMQELSEKLFGQINMVKKSEKCSKIRHPEFPQYLGCINGTEKFDAHFFRVTPKQALCMDPVMRKLMEHTMSALFDAGINPETVKKSKLGVYVGSPTIDMATVLYTDTKGHPFVITGSSKCMLSNRISYWIDGNSSSVTVDHGNAGSMSALEMAYDALKTGIIDYAIVGGANYCMQPELTFNLKRAGLLCLDGKTKCFDKNGDGYVRSEAVNVYFLQRAKDAKRIYSEVYHVKGKYFASPDGLFSMKRNPKDIENFLEEFYAEAGVDPKDVEYVEANSYGIAEADSDELQAIGNVFTKENSIKVGSVKSNMGNTESASGSCSISKMCLSYHKGEIPANIHLKDPISHTSAMKEEKIKIATKNEPFQRSFTAINNFCYTGGNFHALLKGHYKPKDKERYKSSLPRLVLVSSRKEDGVNSVLDNLQSNPIDPEQLALLNNIFKIYIPGYTARGYTVLDTNDNNETVSLSRGFEYFSGTSRPVWFLYSGMGSQWAGMGEGFSRIPVFAAAIERCHNVLLSKGLDLKSILVDKDSKNLNILKSLVAITAVQIGLTDVLNSIGIVPDNLIGHSLGEICCAYADGSLTTEEAILAAYYRALVSYETTFIKGTMAAVGIGYKEVVKLCPPGIEVACHNSFESATISGPSEAVGVFVKGLTDQGVFAKEVASYDIAFHSKYIAEAGPKMLKLLKTAIVDPKPRSKKWLSTCYLPEDWHKAESQYASAEYFTHNLMNSVLFEETARLIPEDAIIVEIAPHGLLQAIMKRSHSECINLSLTKRNEKDNVLFLFKTIGCLYQNGLNPDLESLYPKVEFPVSTETPLLSHLVKWDHDADWILNINNDVSETPIKKEFIFCVMDDDFVFLQNYVKNGVNVLPEAAVVVFVWETLAEFEKKDFRNLSVKFSDVTFHQEVTMQLNEIIKLEIFIQKCSGKFEVTHKTNLIADGTINMLEKNIKPNNNITFNENDKLLSERDIYTLLRLRGSEYKKEYQCIKSMNLSRNKATVVWPENGGWTNFLDSIIQIQALSNQNEAVTNVKFINHLAINTEEHKYKQIISDGEQRYNVLVARETGLIECGGVTFKDMVMKENQIKNVVSDKTKDLKINYFTRNNLDNKSNKVNKNIMQHAKLVLKEKGKSESLTWIEASIPNDKTTVEVHYSGLSSKDFQFFSSSDNQGFGMDFSGIDNNGRRVMGLVPCNAVASSVEADKDLFWPVPQHWSLAEAATVPLPYIHAFYCLAVRHTLSKHDTILVIGAAGALGQAVISIALHYGCRIFATVGNAYKKRFLLKIYPELDENNIGYTYDGSFRAMVIERTRNKKCSIVINTASGTIREEAMKCVGDIFDFHLLDVSDSDQKANKHVQMGYLTANKSYKSVNVATIFENKYEHYKKVLHDMILQGITKKYVKPLTNVLYSPCEVSRAFRLLSNRSNIGRVLIRTKDLQTSHDNLKRIPRLTLHPNKAYIVVCDGSELAIELINVLIQRGARRLMIQCSPKTINGYFHVRYASWRNQGVTLEINGDDLRMEEKCHKLIINIKSLGFVDVDGIFITHNDFPIQQIDACQNGERDMSVIVSNLDKASRDCKNLRYFAVIYANTNELRNNCEAKELEECCLRRDKLELPSLFLHQILDRPVWNSQSLENVFDGLETSLKHRHVSVTSIFKDSTSSLSSKVDHDVTWFDAGFGAFYRRQSRHEFDATEAIIQMKTKSDATSEIELTVNPSNKNIILIPGFDENSESLANIAERLNEPAIALHTEMDNNDTIPQIAHKLLNHINARFQLNSPFHIMGYSFGVNVALEIAALLEKQGLEGVVYCLDSSPDAVKVHLDAYLGALTVDQLQNSLIEHVYKLFTGYESSELKIQLNDTKNWLDKVEIFTNTAKTKVYHSHQYMRKYLEATYNKIKMAKQYKPNFVLRSKLVLLKGVPHPNAQNLSYDYNLSSYSHKQVQVFNIKSDHAMALNDCRVSNFINRVLKHEKAE